MSVEYKVFLEVRECVVNAVITESQNQSAATLYGHRGADCFTIRFGGD